MSAKKDTAVDDGGITRESGSVFADLGFQDAAERQTKTRLALAVNELLKPRKLKQREIAELLHIPRPKVSALKNYRLDQFSVERLMEFLAVLDQDVETGRRAPCAPYPANPGGA